MYVPADAAIEEESFRATDAAALFLSLSLSLSLSPSVFLAGISLLDFSQKSASDSQDFLQARRCDCSDCRD
jgi:hypothetical protein